jgi:hypothetical protein
LGSETKINKQTMDNKLLRESWSQYQYRLIYIIPSVLINNFMFRGEMDGRDVANSICDSFKNLPESCALFSIQHKIDPTPHINYNKTATDEWIYWIITILVIFMLLLAAVVIFTMKNYFTRSANSEVNELVKTHVGDYMKIQETAGIEGLGER